ncbi:MAG: glycosyltransferase, partial [Myxococcota bacterium]|nr:glycosyltransferase [Myxococcota bacterium]
MIRARGGPARVEASQQKLTVLQAKFAAYLSWSQPFLHALVAGLDPHVRNVVLCEHTENLDRFPVRHVERIPTRYLVRPGLAVLAARYLQRTWQPDLMHAHFGWSGLRLLMLKQILRIPLVVTFGGRDVGLQMQLADFRELYGMMLDASDAIVCVSRDLRDKLRDAGADPDRIHVIHRGTDLARFGFVDRSARDPDAPVRILMVGRIVEKKGHRYALEALAGLAAAGRRAELVIVGEGEGYHEVKRLRRRLGLRGRVELAGPTDHAGVRRHMERADLLLHCSVTPPSGDVEGIPNVVVEAQAMGLPVVGTRHGGIAEAVRDGETGLLVSEAEVAPLQRALARLVDDPALRLRMGRDARAFVDAHFSLTRQVEQHLAVYEKVVAHAASDPAWRTRSWLPETCPGLARRALLAHGISHPSEFSIAELIERLLWTQRLEGRLREGGVQDPVAAVELV